MEGVDERCTLGEVCLGGHMPGRSEVGSFGDLFVSEGSAYAGCRIGRWRISHRIVDGWLADDCGGTVTSRRRCFVKG